MQRSRVNQESLPALSFQDRNGWQCQFLEADLKTPLPRKLHFTSPDKIIEIVERGGGLRDQEFPTDAETGNLNGPGWGVPEPDGGSSTGDSIGASALYCRDMRPMFTIHAGEYLVGEYIESHFRNWNVWIPSKDTGIDLLVTDQKNQRTVSLQVKFGKDFLPGKSALMRNSSLRCLSWFTLNRAKLDSSEAEFWVFVLMGFTSDKPDFLVVPTAKLRKHMDEIHGHQEKLQVYLTSTKSKCWETRGLSSDAMLQIATDTYKNPMLDLSNYLNDAGWDALKAKLDH